jgi:hypothetical protein
MANPIKVVKTVLKLLKPDPKLVALVGKPTLKKIVERQALPIVAKKGSSTNKDFLKHKLEKELKLVVKERNLRTERIKIDTKVSQSVRKNRTPIGDNKKTDTAKDLFDRYKGRSRNEMPVTKSKVTPEEAKEAMIARKVAAKAKKQKAFKEPKVTPKYSKKRAETKLEKKLKPGEAKALLRRERKANTVLRKKQTKADAKETKKLTDKTPVVQRDSSGRVIGITTKGELRQLSVKTKNAAKNPGNSVTDMRSSGRTISEREPNARKRGFNLDRADTKAVSKKPQQEADKIVEEALRGKTDKVKGFKPINKTKTIEQAKAKSTTARERTRIRAIRKEAEDAPTASNTKEVEQLVQRARVKGVLIKAKKKAPLPKRK